MKHMINLLYTQMYNDVCALDNWNKLSVLVKLVSETKLII